MMLNYDMLILNSLKDNDIIDDELYEKCLPHYIQNLPGSLRSTDPKELQRRLDAIDKRVDEIDDEIAEEEDFQDFAHEQIDKAEKENKEIDKELDEIEEKEKKFLDDSEKSQGEALDESSELRDRWDDISRDFDFPQSLNILVRGIGEEFENKGFLHTDEVEGLKGVADMLDDYAYDMEEGDDGDISMLPVHEIARDIRDFADKYDINKNSMGDDLTDVMSSVGNRSDLEQRRSNNTEIIDRNNELLTDSSKNVEKLEKERSDMLDNRERTEYRLSERVGTVYETVE